MNTATAKRVLVTGCDGYIGSVLVPQLLQRQYEVQGLDTFYYEDCWFGDQTASPRVIRKDIRDVEVGDLQGLDAVIHLAALSNDPVGQLAPELTLDINYRASVRLAEMAKLAGIRRFLYASSCSLYGKSDKEWVDETSAMEPLTAYAQSKVNTEKELLRLADDSFSPVILRCATVFGTSPKLRIDIVVNNLAGWGVTTSKIRILSDGTPWRPLIHVRDLVDAYEYFLRAPVEEVHNKVLNIGFNEQNYQVRQIADLVGHSLPNVNVVYEPSPDRDSRSYCVRFDRFVNSTGLKAKWDLHSGIREIVDAYQKTHLTYDEFTGRKYVRLNQIRHLQSTKQINSQLRWDRQ